MSYQSARVAFVQSRLAFAAAVMLSSLLLVVLFTAPIAAQRAPMRFGVLAGASMNSITDLDGGTLGGLGESAIANKQRAGVQAGVYAVIPITARLSLQPELHYAQKGGKAELTGIDSTLLASYAAEQFTIGFKFAYVDIPILARMDFGSGTWRPFIVAGPAFALRTTCKVSTELAGLSLDASCDEGESLGGDPNPSAESSDPVKKTDISALGGVGISGQLMGRAISAQLRYSQGLTSIATEKFEGFSPRNRGLSFVLGVGF